MQHAPLTDQGVARDSSCLESQIPPQAHRLVLLVPGPSRSLDKLLYGRCVREASPLPRAHGLERVAREELASSAGERAWAGEDLQQHGARAQRDNHAAGTLGDLIGELPEGFQPPREAGPRVLERVGR